MSTARGVIHDLGYRRFTGQRLGTGAIAWELYRTSLGQAFGIGRSGKAKVVPWLVAGLLLLVGLILAAISVQMGQADVPPPSNYFGFPYWTQLLLTIFVATQAPVLFARDLRYRSIVLYFARPLSRTLFVLVRLAALTTAVFLVTTVPILLWAAAALSTRQETGEQARQLAAALVGVVILSLVLASVAALVSSVATRSGLAVAAVVIVLMVASAVITAALGIAQEQGAGPGVRQALASFTPFTTVAPFVCGLFDVTSPVEMVPVPGAIGTAVAGLVCLAWILLPALALILRTRRAAAL